MGRRFLNKSYDQVLKENRERSKIYYKNNKDSIKEKRMERYNKLKKSSIER